mgnify:CR=1 FL=1
MKQGGQKAALFGEKPGKGHLGKFDFSRKVWKDCFSVLEKQ